ncbi:unnamed protein product [Chondrus crispus]|uniref:Secreted protein n=1 Tax=Chondrus crispus TaxID=2769 RepID=R7QQH6_CHOCR|nr:unnamed protein product [Chondrus crispus]XP_005716378.1 unnamed protein product [Chondrus crispus]CDF36559.1 unnamed protein product [Chondrus crispus]CDF40379.1 unnamed protein product [Chondrus crispus]|eukprot:XP_005710673.1 unnamed protein product [Chondrus crispus]
MHIPHLQACSICLFYRYVLSVLRPKPSHTPCHFKQHVFFHFPVPECPTKQMPPHSPPSDHFVLSCASRHSHHVPLVRKYVLHRA